MQIHTTFERESARYTPELQLRIWMRFSDCTYDEFHAWVDTHMPQLLALRMDFDIGHSDKVLYFS